MIPTGAGLSLGCGNPTAIAALRACETVLDLGSGAGMDAFLAADRVGAVVPDFDEMGLDELLDEGAPLDASDRVILDALDGARTRLVGATGRCFETRSASQGDPTASSTSKLPSSLAHARRSRDPTTRCCPLAASR